MINVLIYLVFHPHNPLSRTLKLGFSILKHGHTECSELDMALLASREVYHREMEISLA